MGTWHEDAVESAFAEAVADPYWADAVDICRDAIRGNVYGGDYLDPLGQPGRGWKDAQIFAFAQMHLMSKRGQLPRILIPVGASPASDSERDVNAAALKGIDSKYVAHLDQRQNGADQDGFLEWTTPIHLRSPGRPALEIPPGQVPLEVGTCHASRVRLHLDQSGAVARWPYGHDSVTLLIRIPKGDADRNLLGIKWLTDEDDEKDFLAAEVVRAAELLRANGMKTTATYLENCMAGFGEDLD